MVQAMSHGLPGSLGTLSEIFKLGDKSKDKEGRALVLLFCKPQKFSYPHKYAAPDEILSESAKAYAAEKRAQVAPLRKVMQTAEKVVEKLQADIKRIDASLADPALFARDPDAVKTLTLERGRKVKDLTAAEEAWLVASEAYEEAKGA